MKPGKIEILHLFKAAKPKLQSKYGLEEIAIFGSYARGEATDDSDIDILVKLNTPAYRNLCNASYFLYDLFPQKKVQIVSKNAITKEYFNHLKNDLFYA